MPRHAEIDTGFYQSYKGQFLAMGDADHGDLGLRKSFYSEKNIAALSRAGFKNIAIEMPACYQAFADQLARGEISADAFCKELNGGMSSYGGDARAIQETAKLIKTAAGKGMRVIFADAQQSSLQQGRHLFDGVFEKHMRIWGEKHGVNVSDAVDKMKHANTAAEAKAAFARHPGLIDYIQGESSNPNSALSGDIVAARRGGDANVGSLIRQQAHGEKTAIVYGGNHFNYGNGGILEHLGQDSVAVLNNQSGRFGVFQVGDGGGLLSGISDTISAGVNGVLNFFSPQSTAAPAAAPLPASHTHNRAKLRTLSAGDAGTKEQSHIKSAPAAAHHTVPTTAAIAKPPKAFRGTRLPTAPF